MDLIVIFQAYIHSRMRAKTSDFLKVLNRARPEEEKEKKLIRSVKYDYLQCCLLITLANSLDPDQALRPDQGPNCLTFLWYS